MRIALGLVLGSLILSCNQADSLESYGEKLVAYSKPGIWCERYLEPLKDYNSIQQFQLSSHDIITRWTYKKDLQGTDRPKRAEILLRTGNLVGDCEDQAIVLAAIARHLGIQSRFCLAKAKKNKSGHIWLEILSDTVKDSETDLNTLRLGFMQTWKVHDQQKTWLAIIRPSDYSRYKPEYYVYCCK